MKNIRRALICSAALVLASCSSNKDEVDDAPVVEAASSRSSTVNKPSGVIPQHQLDALNKAKGVEDILKKSDDEMRKKLEGM